MKAKIKGKTHICTEVFEGVTYEGTGPTYFTAIKELERVIKRETGKIIKLI